MLPHGNVTAAASTVPPDVVCGKQYSTTVLYTGAVAHTVAGAKSVPVRVTISIAARVSERE